MQFFIHGGNYLLSILALPKYFMIHFIVMQAKIESVDFFMKPNVMSGGCNNTIEINSK